MTFDLSPLWISLQTASIATVFTFFLGLLVAYGMLNYQGKGKAVIDGILIAPLVLPPTVLGFLLLLLLGKNGVVGQFLLKFDITIVFSWTATVITAIVVAFPLMYRTTLGAFKQLDQNLIYAARTLGASEWKIFWKVMLPLSLPGIISGTILAFARALGEFGATLMLAGNIPGKTQTIPMAIYFHAEAGDFRTAAIWVSVILTISLGVITVINLWENSGKRPFRSRKYAKTSSFQLESPVVANTGLWVNFDKQLGEFNLNLRLQSQQETIGILGASGSGKSMTLRCIAGLETPSQGQIILNHRVLFDSQKKINVPSCDRNIGFLFQNYALFPHLTVLQNITFGLQHLPHHQQQSQAALQLQLMQLEGLEHRYPHQLSGGQQQRVALARALAIQPEVLLLDEPFSALDTHLRSQLEHQLIQVLKTYSGVTLFVTHNLEEAYRVCENLLVLSQGKIAAFDNKHRIFEHPTSFTVAQLTGCKNFSLATVISLQQIRAVDWNCTLEILEPIPDNFTHIGIRAHHLSFPNNSENLINCFPCWIAQTSETQHRMTLFLKLNSPPEHPQDYHLQAEVFKEKWATLKARPIPWQIHLQPLHIMLLST